MRFQGGEWKFSFVSNCWESSAPPWESHFCILGRSYHRCKSCTASDVWAVPSCAYWTGISVLPENWLSSAGTGVQLTNQPHDASPRLPRAETQPALFPTERCKGVDLESAAPMKVKFSELKSVTEPWSVREKGGERLAVDHCPLLC